MDERIRRGLNTIEDFKQLAQYEINIRNKNAMTNEVEAAIKARAAFLGRRLIAEQIQLDLSNLTPAEEGIVNAAAEYIAIQKKKGKGTPRMISQLRNRGLIEAAEVAVEKPTQGFQALKDDNREDLTYEQIILDHPEEFSSRAAWFARKRFKKPNPTEKPPARGVSPTQVRTEKLLQWLQERARSAGGRLGDFTNTDAAAAIGMTDMNRHGRVFGNIVSRIDLACYRLGFPPLGLTAKAPFENAWNQNDRRWAFPIDSMRRAAREFVWKDSDFKKVLNQTRTLPGQAHIFWKKELHENERGVREWVYGLEDKVQDSEPNPPSTDAAIKSNPIWTREEHILGLDLYLRLRGTSYSEDHPDVIALSATLRNLAGLRGMSGSLTFRNPNGVSMKMMNFRRLDPEYTADGRVGLPSGSKIEEAVWEEFANDREKLANTVYAIYAFIKAEEPPTSSTSAEAPYWVFVCNPAKWAIDDFIASNAVEDTWGVRPADRGKFAPGQLGIVRVGIDRRSPTARNGKLPLKAGIYALCEVLSTALPGTGAKDKYWAEDQGREPGWPTVRIRYLRTYLDKPLTIEQLRTARPGAYHLLLNGHQAASFPLPAEDFHAVMELLGEDTDHLPVVAPIVDTLDRLGTYILD